MKKIERTRKKLNEVILIMILFLQIGRTERQTSCSGRLTIAYMEKCMGFSKRLNINGNTKNYTNREIHEIFKTAEITEENLVFL